MDFHRNPIDDFVGGLNEDERHAIIRDGDTLERTGRLPEDTQIRQLTERMIEELGVSSSAIMIQMISLVSAAHKFYAMEHLGHVPGFDVPEISLQ